MRKIAIFVTAIISVILFYFTIDAAFDVYRASWQMPQQTDKESLDHRLVLITQELDTPFWDKVSSGARNQAEKEGVTLEVWGSYGNNQENFLRQIEIAIYSKVDGIIVQGLDTDEFKELTKVKAASYGIPIITVANDVPSSESLRKTYVGSNQYFAGELIARQLIHDMGTTGEVILMLDSKQEYYQEQRINGIQDYLIEYPDINIIVADTEDAREQGIALTKDLLNRYPNVDAFVAVNSNFTEDIIEEIEKRSKVEPYHIYSFDDNSVSLSLLEQGKLDGMIEQSPTEMGERSVIQMVKWLKNDTVPLNLKGYLTDIRMVKAMDIE
ncbi:substrate-binding domain-containing protein [Aquibacillus koreensis]|uniref:Substrate-binding domain-containing protein n=1 Tax=Aquibacillus koreensis TaxID=279446 RepID=A0A9X3WPH0_9BACI|nr:substrate-binding domain-containing protein [Aquibacillus koreensis]MCT2535190.1 substrate-binding domain-containing protein [Aquibacillus koreensis]MDC3421049.1 substrate-binding domain-containing protein [Aquibacillus koreensis]